jgi:hypothetical protein
VVQWRSIRTQMAARAESSSIAEARARADHELKKALLALDPNDFSNNVRAFDDFIDKVKDLFNEEAAGLLPKSLALSPFKQDLLRLRDVIVDEYTAAAAGRTRTKKQKRRDERPMDIDDRLYVSPIDKWDLFAPGNTLPNKKDAVRQELVAVLGKQVPYWLRQGKSRFVAPQQPLSKSTSNVYKENLSVSGEVVAKPAAAKSAPRRDFLESLSPADPNYERAKQFYLEAWADSHGLVADALAGKASLASLLDGCVRTFHQAAQMHVDLMDTSSPKAKCKEIDRMAKKFIEKVSDALSEGATRVGEENVAEMVEDFSVRVNEIAAGSKRHILLNAMDWKTANDVSRRRHDSPTLLAIGDSNLWKARQVEFEKYQQKFRALTAHWYVSNHLWWFQYGESKEGVLRPPQRPLNVFKAIARVIVAGCPEIRAEIAANPGPRVAANAAPWEVWLDFMRVRNWGFTVTGNVACTELEWDLGVKDGKPLLLVRKEHGHQPSDEWNKVYRRTEGGKLTRLTARELRGKTSDQLRKYYHWLENGSIEHVFEASAQFCEELASRAFELEAAKRVPDGSNDQVRPVGEPLVNVPINARSPATKGNATAQRLGVRLKKLKAEKRFHVGHNRQGIRSVTPNVV